MTAHVSDLTRTEIPVHIPIQAIHAGFTGKIDRIVRVIRRRSKPEIVVQGFGRLALCSRIARPADLAITPDMHGAELADGAVPYQLLNTVEIRLGVTLCAVLCRKFILVLEIGLPDQPNLFNAEADGIGVDEIIQNLL